MINSLINGIKFQFCGLRLIRILLCTTAKSQSLIFQAGGLMVYINHSTYEQKNVIWYLNVP